MAKRTDLRQKLKAADRRRRRRPVAHTPPPASTGRSLTTVDVAGLLIQAILDADGKSTLGRDSVVIAALRGIAQRRPPTAPDARDLYERLSVVGDREDVTAAEFRGAVRQLTEQAESHQGSGTADSFLRYLSVLAS